MEKRNWVEIRCDFLDNTDNMWRVDAWQTDADEEDGTVIALINDSTACVTYLTPLARVDEYAQEVIKDRVNEILARPKVTYIRPLMPEREDSLWYGGLVAEISYKGYTFMLGAYGDVRASLLNENDDEVVYVRDKNNAGAFFEEMKDYISDDFELELLKSNEPLERGGHTYWLVFENNNWWEVLVETPDGHTLDTGWVCNGDLYSEAIAEIMENMDAFIAEEEKTA